MDKADNGDNISNSYTGTGAMKSAYTRTGKRTIKGMVDDSKKSLERVYQNNFKVLTPLYYVSLFSIRHV